MFWFPWQCSGAQVPTCRQLFVNFMYVQQFCNPPNGQDYHPFWNLKPHLHGTKLPVEELKIWSTSTLNMDLLFFWPPLVYLEFWWAQLKWKFKQCNKYISSYNGSSKFLLLNRQRQSSERLCYIYYSHHLFSLYKPLFLLF